jgi:hypothetical protein
MRQQKHLSIEHGCHVLMVASFCEVRAKADETFEYEAYDTMDQYQMAALG